MTSDHSNLEIRTSDRYEKECGEDEGMMYCQVLNKASQCCSERRMSTSYPTVISVATVNTLHT